MKKCPFCEWENEDDASKCLACGTELPVEEKKVVNTQNNFADNGDEKIPEHIAKAFEEAGENHFGVKITNIGANKIAVIKVIKENLNCGLAEAKARCENGIGGGSLSRDRAEAFLSQLRAVGAEGEIMDNFIEQVTTGISGQSATQNSLGDKKNLIIGVLIGVVITMVIIFLLAR